ncbi:MAG: DEAD/DEAH box helicase [Thermodesulfobacteriota bacterium]|nr:DEAD/DEAH box helicase [Thermodesulfobacteriota bacterium]
MNNPILTISNSCTVTGMGRDAMRELTTRLTLDNPAYAEAVKYGRYAGNISRQLRFYEEEQDSLTFPRGFARQACSIIGGLQINDQRRVLTPMKCRLRGNLRPYQKEAVSMLLQRDFGVLEAPTGSGKTVIALAVLAERKQPTLILVHNKELLYQWQDRIRLFLNMEAGLIGDGNCDLQPVTIAIVNTARKHLNELLQHFGFLIVDECHRCPSAMFTEVVAAFDCRYMLGLSATPFRRDKLTRVIYLYLGDRVHRIDQKELQQNGAVLKPEVIWHKTAFDYNYRDDYQAMLSALTESSSRNQQIIETVANGLDNGITLLVSDRVSHCETLANMLKQQGIKTAMLTGQTPKKKRQAVVEQVQSNGVKALVATIQLLGEGFDCPNLSSLVLTTPIKYSGRLIQVGGRILRPTDGKKPVIYDFVDTQVGVLRASAKGRQRVYEAYR